MKGSKRLEAIFFFGILFCSIVDPCGIYAQPEASQEADKSQAEKWLDLAKQRLEEEALSEALEYAKRAEAVLPERIETWITLGTIYESQGAQINKETGFAGMFRRDLLGEAEESFRKALQIDHANLEARKHLAFTLCLLRNMPAALDQIDLILENDPNNVYAHYLRGEVAILQEDAEAALNPFRNALEIDPDFHDAHAGLIEALTLAGRRDEACREIRALLIKAPDLPEILSMAIAVFEPLEWLEDAANLYASLLEITPERTELRFQLGKTLYRLAELDRSERLFDEILQEDQGHEGALYFKGLLAVRRGDLAQGSTLLQQVVEQEGDHYSVALYQLHYIVRILANRGDLEGAAALLEYMVKCDPSNSAVLADKALVFSNAGRKDEADAAYKALLAMEPWDSTYTNDFALHLAGTGRTAEAIAMFNKSIDLDDNEDALENLGSYYHFIVKDDARALPYFERVVEKIPDRTKSLVLREWIQTATD